MGIQATAAPSVVEKANKSTPQALGSHPACLQESAVCSTWCLDGEQPDLLKGRGAYYAGGGQRPRDGKASADSGDIIRITSTGKLAKVTFQATIAAN